MYTLFPYTTLFRSAMGGGLASGGRRVSDRIAAAGGETPLFVYDAGIVAARIARLRAALPKGVAVHYAVKANPHPPLVRWMAGRVEGLDVASGGELALVLEAGGAGDRISFAGPGKTERELEAALTAGVTVNLESDGEFSRLLALGERAGDRKSTRLNYSP